MHPVIRYEHVINDDILAAGALQAENMPGVLNGKVGSGQQKGAVIAVAGVADQPAQQNPAAIFAAAGEFPAA